MNSIKHPGFCAAVLLFLLNITPFSLAAHHSIQCESMRDLKGIYVSIERLASEIRNDGLTENVIRKDAELMLRKAGIKVFSKNEWLDVEGSPCLYVNANVLKLLATREYIYSVNISLKQTVYPIRKPIEISGAATWSIGGTIGITPDLKKIRASVKEQVEEFIKAYLSVNPK